MKETRRIVVVGAGQMGQGIAQTAASCGYEVALCDQTIELARTGKERVDNSLRKLVKRGRITPEQGDTIAERVTCLSDLEEGAQAALLIEAASEDFSIKSHIFRNADQVMEADAFFASNTSSISITKLASQTTRPDRFIGIHFMNPVPAMKLVEVIRALQTSDDTYRFAVSFVEKLGKHIVSSADSPAFIVNRMLMPMLNEACFALQEKVGSAEDIDKAVRLGLRHPMGPLELADFVGLDTVLAISEVLVRDTGDSKYRAPVLLRNYVSAGWLGRKTGRGFYIYEAGERVTNAKR